MYVSLSNSDRGRTFTVHRLVANAFCLTMKINQY